VPDLQDHPEYVALMAAVRAAPPDDLPRLVLADWLEEHAHDEWAEFVRAQCEVERHPHADRIFADTYTDTESVHRDWQSALTAARRVRELWPAVGLAIFPDHLRDGQRPHVTRNGRCFFSVERGFGLPQSEVRRGFVSGIECSLDDWCGPECRECDGGGWVRRPFSQTEWEGCPACGGVGRAGGIGPRVGQQHPIERVTLTDREPDLLPYSQFGWWAVRDPVRQTPAHIPWVLFDQLDGGTDVSDRDELRCMSYHSQPAALAALSDAAVGWATGRPTRNEFWKVSTVVRLR
jgi:uncharacterized protein (TIGR02996 family)